MQQNSPKPLWRQILGLMAWLVVCFAAAAVGGFGSQNAPDFYTVLSKPAWAPSASVFGPVWTFLYTLMAVSAWLMWRSGVGQQSRWATACFLGQLALNAFWTWTFFAWHLGAWSSVVIVALLAAICWTVVEFWRINRLAAVLLGPYLAWVAFATALNFALWRANPTLL